MHPSSTNHQKRIPFLVALALFMESVDTTIINTAIPRMASYFHIHPLDMKIALISYLLSLALFIPISGWVADKWGAKPVFLWALALFTMASWSCGMAQNLNELVIARFFQGLGGSFTLPVGRLILARSFARHELIESMNRVIIVASLGSMLGPVFGGFIVHHFFWQWIFWVNIPIGILALFMGYYWLPTMPTEKTPPLDFLGFLFFGLGLAGFTFSLSALSETEIQLRQPLIILGIALLLWLGYFMHSRHRANPIIKLALFKFHTFRISMLANLCSRLGFGAIPFLQPFLFQIALGLPAYLSGLLLVPIAFGVISGKLLFLRLAKAMGYRRLLISNTLALGFFIFLFAFVQAHTPLLLIAVLNFIFGSLTTLQYTGMNSLAYAEIPPAYMSSHTSLMSTLQQLSQSFAVAVSAIIIRVFQSFSGDGLQVSLSILHSTFITLGVLMLLSSIIFLEIRPGEASQMISP